MRDTRAKEAAALARLNQNYGFLLVGPTQGIHLTSPHVLPQSSVHAPHVISQ